MPRSPKGREVEKVAFVWCGNINHHVFSHPKLVGGFTYFLFFTPTWGRFPTWLIFFRWVETTNLKIVGFYQRLQLLRIEKLVVGRFKETVKFNHGKLDPWLLTRLQRCKQEEPNLPGAVQSIRKFGASRVVVLRCWWCPTSGFKH